MRNAMLEQNNTLKTIYHRLYDLEKTYFRPHMKKKKKGKDDSPKKDAKDHLVKSKRASAGCFLWSNRASLLVQFASNRVMRLPGFAGLSGNVEITRT